MVAPQTVLQPMATMGWCHMIVQVLVMEDGRVKEYDSPANLMQIPNGTFRAMVVEAGLADDSPSQALQ